jgi:hypothetical protein
VLHLFVVHDAVAVLVGAPDGEPGPQAGKPRGPAADGLPEPAPSCFKSIDLCMRVTSFLSVVLL